LGAEGSILGIVQDTSGAVVVRASVTLTNNETGLKTTLSVSGDGYFQALALPTGTYSVDVSAPGFVTWRVTGLILRAGEQKRVTPLLGVADTKQGAPAKAPVELVQTERASVEMAIEQKQIRDLPLNGRIAVQMVALTPGMRFLGIGGAVNGSSSANVQGAN